MFRRYRAIIVKYEGMEETAHKYTRRLYKALINNNSVSYMYVI